MDQQKCLTEDDNRKIFGPLMLPQQQNEDKSTYFEDENISCCLCCLDFVLPRNQTEFLDHLFDSHNLIIFDISSVADLKKYITYWSKIFKDVELSSICLKETVDVSLNGRLLGWQTCFILGKYSTDDAFLRKKLHNERLEHVLQQQAKEREDTSFIRSCLFCKAEISSKKDYLNHLSHQHNFQLGHPENLVFIDDLINIINDTLERLQCLYCERIFKDRTVLKEHMRKKQHKRINPENEKYDRYYIINYLEMGKNWRHFQKDDDAELSVGDPEVECDSDWSDWSGGNSTTTVVCLFCDISNSSFDYILEHMTVAHKFKYRNICEELNLNFYEQVKLVNYIRHQIYTTKCVFCAKRLPSKQELVDHMTTEAHFVVPPRDVWNQPEFYFPTYENDNFLCQLDVKDDVEEQPHVSWYSFFWMRNCREKKGRNYSKSQRKQEKWQKNRNRVQETK